MSHFPPVGEGCEFAYRLLPTLRLPPTAYPILLFPGIWSTSIHVIGGHQYGWIAAP